MSVPAADGADEAKVLRVCQRRHFGIGDEDVHINGEKGAKDRDRPFSPLSPVLRVRGIVRSIPADFVGILLVRRGDGDLAMVLRKRVVRVVATILLGTQLLPSQSLLHRIRATVCAC